jgi:lysophospholipase
MASLPTDLPPRFHPPEGWRTGFFTSGGHRLVYGSIVPAGVTSAVVLLPGRSEFREKHFETMRDLTARGHAVFVMDWYGQGSSERMPDHPQKDWNIPYETHLSDFDCFIKTIVRPALPQGAPLYMIAHSMGGHIGLRYLTQHSGIFNAAAFSAPMLGLKAVGFLSYDTAIRVASLFNPQRYIWGGHDWHEGSRGAPGTDIFSSDPVRDAVHMAWVRANPDLRHGEPTFGWVKNALISCRTLFAGDALSHVTVPCLFAAAGNDALVDNNAIKRAASLIPGARFIHLDGARHEILMEKDIYRDAFLNGFDNLTGRVKMSPA